MRKEKIISELNASLAMSKSRNYRFLGVITTMTPNLTVLYFELRGNSFYLRAEDEGDFVRVRADCGNNDKLLLEIENDIIQAEQRLNEL